ncbi:MAG: hypothetical protein Q3998_02565 [Porphyromonas sp.]|nr:hypothetical protein [Porphyromonas sp.]
MKRNKTARALYQAIQFPLIVLCSVCLVQIMNGNFMSWIKEDYVFTIIFLLVLYVLSFFFHLIMGGIKKNE